MPEKEINHHFSDKYSTIYKQKTLENKQQKDEAVQFFNEVSFAKMNEFKQNIFF